MEITLSTANHYTAIDQNGDLLESTKEQYRRAIDRALLQGVDLTDALAIGRYAQTLPSSNAYYLRGALNAYAKYMTVILESQVKPETYQTTAAAIMRLNALAGLIRPKKATTGTKAHTWLNRAEVAQLLAAPDVSTKMGLRDWALLALLVGGGLRREEAARLMWSAIQRQGDRWVLEVSGKGNKNRIVPISQRMYDQLTQWRLVTGSVGTIVRRVRKGDNVTDNGISLKSVNKIVAKCGMLIGRPELQPHDLRRTYAQIGLDHGIPIQQISILLGHSSILITQTYLNLELDLSETISDFVPF